jgi:exopolysaccharide biosynthesis WecB/TagA/CpsF family protein
MNGIRYDNIEKKEALKILEGYLDEPGQKRNVFFLNIDCIYKAQNDRDYADILRTKADLVLGDGIGIRLLTRLQGEKMVENLNGTDFSPELMKLAAGKKKSVHLLGGYDGVAEKAGRKFSLLTGVKVAGTHTGYFKDDQRVIDHINNSGADILFVGFGVPQQEKWIIKYREALKPSICLGVGALFDYNAGRIKRSPRLFRTMHLEWLWRVFMEPARLFHRYFICDIPLLFRLSLSGTKITKDPSWEKPPGKVLHPPGLQA